MNREGLAIFAAEECVLAVNDDAMRRADRLFQFHDRFLAGIGNVHAAAEVTPGPRDRIPEWQSPFGCDAQEGEMDLPRKGAGIKRCRIAADTQDVFMRLAVTGKLAAAFDPLQGAEPF